MFCFLSINFNDGRHYAVPFASSDDSSALDLAISYLKSYDFSEIANFSIDFISEDEYNTLIKI